MRLTSVSGVLFTTIMLVACASSNTPEIKSPFARSTALGFDPRLGQRLDSLINAGVAAGAAPGVAVVVGRHGQVVHERGYGRIDVDANSARVTDSTRFDLASLTKVMGTTTAAMILEEEGKLDISKPVSFYLPEFNAPDKAAITVKNLLVHNAGFRSGAPLWREQHTIDAFIRAMNERPLVYATGDSMIYSDWDLILTGAIVERLTGTTLDKFLQQRVWGPLGMHDTGFNPLATGPAPADANCMFAFRPDHPLLPLIAVTERDTVYRKTLVRGVVHDENACALGGVAGHAGLFSSARDLSTFARMMLNGGSLDGVRILQPTTIARWTARQGPRSSRALGWDTPSPGSSAGHFFSPRSFGHTGFTGTSIWLDPEKGIYVVLLTNRVNPTRANMKHEALRRAIADIVQQSVRDAPVVEWQNAMQASRCP